MISAIFVMLFQAVAGEPATPVPAVTATPSAQPESTEAPAASETPEEARLRELRARREPVCRSVRVAGSRLPKRICSSEAQDAVANSDSRAWIDRVQSQMPTKY